MAFNDWTVIDGLAGTTHIVSISSINYLINEERTGCTSIFEAHTLRMVCNFFNSKGVILDVVGVSGGLITIEQSYDVQDAQLFQVLYHLCGSNITCVDIVTLDEGELALSVDETPMSDRWLTVTSASNTIRIWNVCRKEKKQILQSKLDIKQLCFPLEGVRLFGDFVVVHTALSGAYVIIPDNQPHTTLISLLSLSRYVTVHLLQIAEGMESSPDYTTTVGGNVAEDTEASSARDNVSMSASALFSDLEGDTVPAGYTMCVTASGRDVELPVFRSKRTAIDVYNRRGDNNKNDDGNVNGSSNEATTDSPTRYGCCHSLYLLWSYHCRGGVDGVVIDALVLTDAMTDVACEEEDTPKDKVMEMDRIRLVIVERTRVRVFQLHIPCLTNVRRHSHIHNDFLFPLVCEFIPVSPVDSAAMGDFLVFPTTACDRSESSSSVTVTVTVNSSSYCDSVLLYLLSSSGSRRPLLDVWLLPDTTDFFPDTIATTATSIISPSDVYAKPFRGRQRQMASTSPPPSPSLLARCALSVTDDGNAGTYPEFVMSPSFRHGMGLIQETTTTTVFGRKMLLSNDMSSEDISSTRVSGRKALFRLKSANEMIEYYISRLEGVCNENENDNGLSVGVDATTVTQQQQRSQDEVIHVLQSSSLLSATTESITQRVCTAVATNLFSREDVVSRAQALVWLARAGSSFSHLLGRGMDCLDSVRSRVCDSPVDSENMTVVVKEVLKSVSEAIVTALSTGPRESRRVRSATSSMNRTEGKAKTYLDNGYMEVLSGIGIDMTYSLAVKLILSDYLCRSPRPCSLSCLHMWRNHISNVLMSLAVPWARCPHAVCTTWLLLSMIDPSLGATDTDTNPNKRTDEQRVSGMKCISLLLSLSALHCRDSIQHCNNCDAKTVSNETIHVNMPPSRPPLPLPSSTSSSSGGGGGGALLEWVLDVQEGDGLLQHMGLISEKMTTAPSSISDHNHNLISDLVRITEAYDTRDMVELSDTLFTDLMFALQDAHTTTTWCDTDTSTNNEIGQIDDNSFGDVFKKVFTERPKDCVSWLGKANVAVAVRSQNHNISSRHRQRNMTRSRSGRSLLSCSFCLHLILDVYTPGTTAMTDLSMLLESADIYMGRESTKLSEESYGDNNDDDVVLDGLHNWMSMLDDEVKWALYGFCKAVCQSYIPHREIEGTHSQQQHHQCGSAIVGLNHVFYLFLLLSVDQFTNFKRSSQEVPYIDTVADIHPHCPPLSSCCTGQLTRILHSITDHINRSNQDGGSSSSKCRDGDGDFFSKELDDNSGGFFDDNKHLVDRSSTFIIDINIILSCCVDFVYSGRTSSSPSTSDPNPVTGPVTVTVTVLHLEGVLRHLITSAMQQQLGMAYSSRTVTLCAAYCDCVMYMGLDLGLGLGLLRSGREERRTNTSSTNTSSTNTKDIDKGDEGHVQGHIQGNERYCGGILSLGRLLQVTSSSSSSQSISFDSLSTMSTMADWLFQWALVVSDSDNIHKYRDNDFQRKNHDHSVHKSYLRHWRTVLEVLHRLSSSGGTETQSLEKSACECALKMCVTHLTGTLSSSKSNNKNNINITELLQILPDEMECDIIMPIFLVD
eukprot:gene1476-2839_t